MTARRVPLRPFALGLVVFAVACNLLTGVEDLEVGALDGGGASDRDGATSDGTVTTLPEGSSTVDATARDASRDANADAIVYPFPECPEVVAPIRTDFDDDVLPPAWEALRGLGPVDVTNGRLELSNGGAIVAVQAMDVGGGIHVFGRFNALALANPGPARKLAVYTRSDGTIGANQRPTGLACIIDDLVPRIRIDGPDAGILASGRTMANAPPAFPLLDFDVFDDGTNIRCGFFLAGGDVSTVKTVSSFRPAGPSRVMIQEQTSATEAIEYVGVEHGIPQSPTHHFEFEGFDPSGTTINDKTIDQSFEQSKLYNEIRAPLSRTDRIFGGYGVLGASAGLGLGENSCCSPGRNKVVTFARSAFTLAFWAKVDALPASFATLLGNGGPDSGLDVRVLSTGVVRATLDEPTRSAVVESTAPVLPVAKWVHIALTRDSTAVQLWINGALVASTAGGTPINLDNPRDLVAGYLEGVDTSVATGGIDGIKTYDRALTACQIRVLASPAVP